MKAFINPTETDNELLRKILLHRLSMAAITKTNLNSSQNKCEGSNRGLVKSVPKHMTFRGTFRARVNASVHSQNNLPGESLVKMLQAVGASISPGSKIVWNLLRRDRWHMRDKERKRSIKYKTARAARRYRKFKEYDENKASLCYKSGMADEQHAEPPTKTNRVDHLYSRKKQC